VQVTITKTQSTKMRGESTSIGVVELKCNVTVTLPGRCR